MRCFSQQFGKAHGTALLSDLIQHLQCFANGSVGTTLLSHL
jgi:hypothetical protein